jgi:hypothetical protein
VPDSDLLPDVEQSNEHPNEFPVAQRDRQQPEGRTRTILTKPVIISISNYAVLAFLEIGHWSLLSLAYTTAIKLGGLGIDPARMGACLGVQGILDGIVQLTVSYRIINSLGPRRSFITFMSCFLPSFLLFPINGTCAQKTGLDNLLWLFVLIHLLCVVGINSAYSTQPLYVSSIMMIGSR